MRHLRRYNEMVSQEDREDIKDILQSWIDDLDFHIINYDEPFRSVEEDAEDGIYYRIKFQWEGSNWTKIYFNVNNIDRYQKEFDELKVKLNDLVEHLKSRGLKNVSLQDCSKYVSKTQRYLVVYIDTHVPGTKKTY